MGMNYYFNEVTCPHCEDEYTAHIGKSSAGWQFNFRGYIHQWENTDIFGIKSLKDWLKYFDNHDGGIIIDEQNRVITKQAFIEIVEHKQAKEGNKNHVDEYPDDCASWKDDEGYIFTDCDLS